MKVVKTKDNSYTLYSEKYGEHYHSFNGAETESEHIFVNLGLKNIDKKRISILEIGYGTGLNAILTYNESVKSKQEIFYHGIDTFPIIKNVFKELQYSEKYNIDENIEEFFYKYWNKKIRINEEFEIFKEQIDFNLFQPVEKYDLIYFDAFSPESHPDMWTYQNLEKIIGVLNPNGVFVTYCSQGILKRNLRELGMFVKRFAGPPGKRHVVRATKI